MRKWILGLLLFSGTAAACAVLGQVAINRVVEVGLTASLSEQYRAIRLAVQEQVGTSYDGPWELTFAVTVERSLGPFGRTTVVKLFKGCGQTVEDALDDFEQQFAGLDPEGSGGDLGDPGDFGSWAGGEDPFANCHVWNGGTSCTSVGNTQQCTFHPSELVCPT